MLHWEQISEGKKLHAYDGHSLPVCGDKESKRAADDRFPRTTYVGLMPPPIEMVCAECKSYEQTHDPMFEAGLAVGRDLERKNVGHDWPRVYSSLRSGGSGSDELGVALHVKIARPLTETDKRAISDAMGALDKELMAETARLDPANIAWKVEWLAEARNLLDVAGLGPIYIKEIANKYCGPKCCPHRVWLQVTTRLGMIEVGWRKRVLSIDWSESDILTRADELFLGEDTTQGDRMIHAWSYEKATEYLRVLASHAPGRRSP